MARKTKAEREQEALRKHAEEVAERKASWQGLLMSALARATARGFDITVSKDSRHFVVRFVNEFDDCVKSNLPYGWEMYEDTWNLEQLVYELDRLDHRDAEAARVEEVKRTALLKLSDEERKVLGF